MARILFFRMVNALEQHDPYFQQRPDAIGCLGFMAKQKCTSVMRQLVYGACADMVDKYTRVAESAGQEALRRFCDSVVVIFGPTYMRSVNDEDVRQLLEVNTTRGKLNDITMVEMSHVFNELLQGKAPPVNFSVNGHEYKMGYHLTDGIYPKWATFLKSIKEPFIPKQAKFARRQEAIRKDVEHAFGVLQSRFKVIKDPSLAYNQNDLARIMTCCICLHNMIVEDERHLYLNYKDIIREIREDAQELASTITMIMFQRKDSVINSIEGYLKRRADVENRELHLQLQEDMMEHVWSINGPIHE